MNMEYRVRQLELTRQDVMYERGVDIVTYQVCICLLVLVLLNCVPRSDCGYEFYCFSHQVHKMYIVLQLDLYVNARLN